LKCLDGNEAGEVYAIACNPGNYQRWKIRRPVADLAFVEIRNVQTGRCLMGENTEWARVTTEPCANVPGQGWAPL
jgi:hypothetical protein